MRSGVSLILAEHLQSSETERTCAISGALYRFRLLRMNIHNIYVSLVLARCSTISFLFVLCTLCRIFDNKWKAVVTKLDLETRM